MQFSGIDPVLAANKKLGLKINSMNINPILKMVGIGEASPIALNYAIQMPVCVQAPRIVLIGCGGTGSHLLPNVLQYCWAKHAKTGEAFPEIVLCDGDRVERKNLMRQRFTSVDLEENKAAALARRYSGVFGVKIKVRDEYLKTSADLSSLAPPDRPNIIIGAVDNHRARAIIWQYMYAASQYYDVLWVDAGNEGWHGQVVLGTRVQSSTRLAHWTNAALGEKINGVDLPTFFDEFPTEFMKIGATPSVPQNECAIMVEQDPQTIQANMMSAFCASSLVIQALSGTIRTSKLSFDAVSGNTAATFLTKMNIGMGLLRIKESRTQIRNFLSGLSMDSGKADDFLEDEFDFLQHVDSYVTR